MFTLTGRLADVKTLLTAWISLMMRDNASAISVLLVAAKYLPPPTEAVLLSSAVCAAST